MTGKPETQRDYFERINKVLTHIHNHLDEEMDLELLANVSNYSVFHFHRIMRAYLGESLGTYIIRIRLDRAAHLLRFAEMPINEIAFKVGYDNPSSFNKAFKKRFQVSPIEFRENKYTQFLADGSFIKLLTMENTIAKPKIKNLKEKKVIYIRSIGEYGNLKMEEAWNKVCDFAQKNKLFGFSTEFIGISYDDPRITESEKCRYDACLTVSKEVKPNGEIGTQSISGGKYALFTHKGPYDKLSNTYSYIFSKWVPENNIELRNCPGFEKYLNDPKKTKPEKLETEIYIPIN